MAKPMIVVVSASQMPLASTAGFTAVCAPIARKTFVMPSTVPSNPSSGEITDASRSSVIARFTFRKCLWNRNASSARRSLAPRYAGRTASEKMRISGLPARAPAAASSRAGSRASAATCRRNAQPVQPR